LPGQRAFIVTDPVLHKLGFTDRISQHLQTAGLEVTCFPEVEPEPSLQTVLRGAEAIREFEPDWIVGLGGGSAMDAAKAMWVVYERPDISPAEINPMVQLGLGQKARLLTIPTTAGTGAEATWYAVLTDIEEGRKLGLGSRESMATLAVVDPELTVGLPPRITADTGIDVLTHAIEGYTSSMHNDFSDGLCLQAAKLVFEYLPRAVADGHDLEAREKMAVAATLGGLGFGNSMAALAHALGHSLGAVFHQAHGRCVGVYLPYTIQYTANAGAGRYADIAYFLRLHPHDDEATAAKTLAGVTRDLMRQVGQPVTVAEMGITREDYEATIERLCDWAEMDTQIVMAARIPNREELANLYRYAYDGREIDF
jgi:alcohol dehydrogenase class IV